MKHLTPVLLGAALALSQAPCAAQTELRPATPAQSLSCLVKPAKAPSYPVINKLDRGQGAMRLKLSFSKPDAAPTVEVLYNSARPDMQEQVYDYVAGYRLPCLSDADGTVSAVQEFSFSNNERDATPIPPERPAPGQELPFCLVMPRSEIDPPVGGLHGNAEHVVIAATFTGDGQQPPEMHILHSTHNTRFEHMVQERLAEYRMPCRKAGSAPQSFRQQFSFFPTDRPRYGLKREAFGLVEFLGLTRDPLAQSVRFDFNTMGCPFKVNYWIYGGSVPNEASEVGREKAKPDPNKLPFLAWLASQDIRFANERQANDLFGSQMQINVPCTVLDLQKKG